MVARNSDHGLGLGLHRQFCEDAAGQATRFIVEVVSQDAPEVRGVVPTDKLIQQRRRAGGGLEVVGIDAVDQRRDGAAADARIANQQAHDALAPCWELHIERRASDRDGAAEAGINRHHSGVNAVVSPFVLELCRVVKRRRVERRGGVSDHRQAHLRIRLGSESQGHANVEGLRAVCALAAGYLLREG